MAWLVALLIFLTLLALLLFTSLGISLHYREKFTLTLHFFGLSFRLIGRKKEKTSNVPGKKHPPKEKKKKPSPFEGVNKAELVVKGSGRIRELLEGYRKIFLHLRIEKLDFHMTVASKDSALTGLLYGAAWSAVSTLHALLRRMVDVKNCRVRIDADFLEDETRVELDAKIAIRFIYLWIAVWIVRREYRKFIRELKQKKDGAKHE